THSFSATFEPTGNNSRCGHITQISGYLKERRPPPPRLGRAKGRASLLGSQSEEIVCSIRVRIFASGMRPLPVFRLSCRCSGLFVAGITQVTAGCAMIHLRNNCAQ